MLQEFGTGLEGQLDAAREKAEKFAEEELGRQKQRLIEDRQRILKELEAKNEEQIAARTSKHKQKKAAMMKTFAAKRNAVAEKHRLNQSAIEKEHELKMRLLPEPRLTESDKLQAEIRVQDWLREAKLRISKGLNESSGEFGRQAQLEMEKDLQAKIQKERIRCETAANARLAEAEKEVAHMRDSIRGMVSAVREIGEAEKAKRMLEISLVKRSADLGSAAKKAKEAEGLVQDLELQCASLRRQLDPSTVLAEPDAVAQLQHELDAKNSELDALRTQVANTRKLLETAEQAAPVPQIRVMNDKLEEIKSLLIRRRIRNTGTPASVQIPPRRAASRQDDRSRENALRKRQEHQARQQRKLTEILAFARTEKTSLLASKKAAVRDYNLSVKLRKNLDYSRQDWGKELSVDSYNDTNQPVLDDLRSSLDRQMGTLASQARRIK